MKKLENWDKELIRELTLHGLGSWKVGRIFGVSHTIILRLNNKNYREKDYKRNREYHRKYYSKGFTKPKWRGNFLKRLKIELKRLFGR